MFITRTYICFSYVVLFIIFAQLYIFTIPHFALHIIFYTSNHFLGFSGSVFRYDYLSCMFYVSSNHLCVPYLVLIYFFTFPSQCAPNRTCMDSVSTSSGKSRRSLTKRSCSPMVGTLTVWMSTSLLSVGERIGALLQCISVPSLKLADEQMQQIKESLCDTKTLRSVGSIGAVTAPSGFAVSRSKPIPRVSARRLTTRLPSSGGRFTSIPSRPSCRQ